MRKIIVVILAVFLSGINASFSQAPTSNVLDGVYVREHYPYRPATALAYLREADVMWSKKIWRVIDLKEKMNLPFAWPLSKQMKDRKSLIDMIMDAVEEGSVTAYNEDEFITPKTKEELAKIGGAGVDSTTITDPEPPYNVHDTVIIREFSRDKIVAYRIKEEWFFDKQRSVMDVRIIGIAPLFYEVDEKGNQREGAKKVPTFWIYFPEIRGLLAQTECFNPHNDAERRTYDDIFQKRMFASYIMKESNVFDRRIEEYRQGMDALVESERIKTDITNMEHDLWEY
ncbi:MAG TPA: gliding motility protein GldN [Bacteroidia bacterium]|nr:gliding motility protein GldN [Bacteroidia bacterium]